MLPWGEKVTHYLVQVDMPSKSFEGTEEEYRYEDVEKVNWKDIAHSFMIYQSMEWLSIRPHEKDFLHVYEGAI